MSNNPNEKQSKNRYGVEIPSYWRIPKEREAEALELLNQLLMKHGIHLQDFADYLCNTVIVHVAEDKHLFERTPIGMCIQLNSFCHNLVKLSNLMPDDIQSLAKTKEIRDAVAMSEQRLRNRVVELELEQSRFFFEKPR